MDDRKFRKQLIELRAGLREAQETGDTAEETVELDQTRVGRLSRMDAMQAQAMSIETGRRRRQQLLRIEAALRRIDEGEYGYCQDCGEGITEPRLKIDPATLLCIDCASRKET